MIKYTQIKILLEHKKEAYYAEFNSMGIVVIPSNNRNQPYGNYIRLSFYLFISSRCIFIT